MTLGGKLARAFSLLRQRYSGRQDTEHEQAFVRLIIGVLLLLYYLWVSHRDPAVVDWNANVIGPISGFILVSVLMLIRIAFDSGVSQIRRVLAATLDTSMAVYFVFSAGEWSLPLYFLFLWIIVGYGFRYGRGYLLYTLGLSLAGFGGALFVHPYWIRNQSLGAGLWVGMLVVSLYVNALIGRLKTALQNAEAANQAKRRFISSVSHELRTPLNAVIGMADLLQTTPLGPEQKDMVDSLNNASHVMLALIEDVLDFSKIEAGKLVVERTQFDLRHLINTTVDVFKHQAAQRGLGLSATLDRRVPAVLLGDPRLLRQVLVNLLSNAIKFTETGRIDLRVAVLTESPPEIGLHFEVEDTGIGIAADAQARIFESFAQADESTSRRYGGTGLGTTISRQLVELMGGQLGLHSVEQVGSTFWFDLTLQQGSALAAAAQSNAGAEKRHDDAALLLSGRPHARYRVLVAEDNPVNAKVLRKVLERAGHECALVENGQEALDRLGRQNFDVVVMDMNMPVMNGLEAAAGYRAMRRADERIPLIMFSADVTTEAKADSLAAGADAFLSKPIQVQTLLDTLDRLVAGFSPSLPQPQAIREADAPALFSGAQPETPGAILDYAVLEQFQRMGDRAFVEDLLLTFIEDNRMRLLKLEQLAAAARHDEFRRTVHSMGGSAATMGATSFRQVCQQAERQAADAGRNPQSVLENMQAAFEQLCGVLEQYRRSLHAPASDKPAGS